MRGLLPLLFSFNNACGKIRSSVMRFIKPLTPMKDVSTAPLSTNAASSETTVASQLPPACCPM